MGVLYGGVLIRKGKIKGESKRPVVVLYMLKAKRLKIRPSGSGRDHSSKSRCGEACDCFKNSTRREKLIIRCYPLKTLHQIPHVLANFHN